MFDFDVVTGPSTASTHETPEQEAPAPLAPAGERPVSSRGQDKGEGKE